MNRIDSIEALDALYSQPHATSLRKVVAQLTPAYRKWIAASRVCMLSTVGPEGTDVSPRGDDGPVVLELDPGHLALPDWSGNNRLDSLRNIVRDGRVSLLFLVPGDNVVVRINGTAIVTDNDAMRARFEQRGRHPRTVIVIRIKELYAQCPKALIRSGLWGRDDSADLPTLGDFLMEATDGDIGGPDWDAAYPARIEETIW
ncbi:pyridoxamine 5'-phosphate oxidase family protein [Poseidonocella sedimentorum]|uniref:Pyridoxamine 5'-phosphate oxidase N-terminal domain-containing protein n=1 Tax=Poseidonocella sedimentorum TaxID=871652 RepID=A0A1I6DAF0_9RHOB|nr:pyridoxamine 5'-phosphate oxidase family protein [Poseidonocella sedimentorum]SFR02302.1 hypothetical protein SAMN04515673_102492 [Poseidonocella sedimentorum]